MNVSMSQCNIGILETVGNESTTLNASTRVASTTLVALLHGAPADICNILGFVVCYSFRVGWWCMAVLIRCSILSREFR